MFVQFTSDSSIGGQGFVAEYNCHGGEGGTPILPPAASPCAGGVTLTESAGTIDFFDGHDSDEECSWTITCPAGSSGTPTLTFKEFDTDDSGELDKDEFRNALRWKLGLMNISTKDIDDLFDHYDTDGGGGIDVDEFIDKVMPKDFTSENGVIDLPCTTSLKVSHFGLFYAFHFCPLTCLLVVSEVCFGRRCPPRFHVSFDV